MSASGPSKEHADNVGVLVATECLSLLRDKYNVVRPHPDMPLGEKLVKEWDEGSEELKRVIQRLVWIDHCATW